MAEAQAGHAFDLGDLQPLLLGHTLPWCCLTLTAWDTCFKSRGRYSRPWRMSGPRGFPSPSLLKVRVQLYGHDSGTHREVTSLFTRSGQLQEEICSKQGVNRAEKPQI